MSSQCFETTVILNKFIIVFMHWVVFALGICALVPATPFTEVNVPAGALLLTLAGIHMTTSIIVHGRCFGGPEKDERAHLNQELNEAVLALAANLRHMQEQVAMLSAHAEGV